VPALILIARAEWRARWTSLLLIGLLGGLAGAMVVGSAGLARRTATADARLSVATTADDVRSLVVGGDRAATLALGEEAVELPGVARGRVALGTVGRIEGAGVNYVSVLVGPTHWGDDILSPVLSVGRLPDPDEPDEVVLNEAFRDAGAFGLDVGDELTLHFLTVEEFASFDAARPLTGEAGTQRFRVVGLARWPGSPQDLPPIVGSPALARAHPDAIGLLGTALVQLEPGADLAAYVDAINAIGGHVQRPEVTEGFPAVSVAGTAAEARSATRTTTGVLATGLLVLAGLATAVGLVAVAQAALRHHTAGLPEQQVEAAIGLSTGDRTRARLLAAVPAIGVAAAMTLAGGIATAGIAPPGQLRTIEPHPGWVPNWAVIAAVVVGVVVVLGLVVALTAARTVTAPRYRRPRESRMVSRAVALGGRPPTVLGLRFALERTGGAGGISGWTAMATIAVGIAGILGSITYAASLDRLVSTPLRYGYPTDLVIADAGPDVAGVLRDDPRLARVIQAHSADVLVDGRSESGVAFDQGERVAWELADGRPPATRDEIALGTRIADELDKGVGDVVQLRDRTGARHPLAVVGVGVLPNFDGSGVGRSVAVTSEALEAVAAADPFDEVALDVRAGEDVGAVADDLAERYEVQVAELPREVSNLADIDDLPLLLAGLLALLCVTTMGHAITLSVRRRRAELATVRALGFTARQTRTTIVVLAVTVGAIASLIAVPIGVSAGATVWRLVAEGAAVLGDARVPILPLLLAVPVTVVLAVGLAARPARRAGRQPVVATLRSE
jgi:hypothetical protein